MKDFMAKIKDESISIWLFAGFCFMLGLVLGFLISPIKKGLSIGNNNTSIGSGFACKTPISEDTLNKCCCGSDDDFYDCDFDDDEDEVKF